MYQLNQNSNLMETILKRHGIIKTDKFSILTSDLLFNDLASGNVKKIRLIDEELIPNQDYILDVEIKVNFINFIKK